MLYGRSTGCRGLETLGFSLITFWNTFEKSHSYDRDITQSIRNKRKPILKNLVTNILFSDQTFITILKYSCVLTTPSLNRGWLPEKSESLQYRLQPRHLSQ